MEINVMYENEVRHMYRQGYTVKQIGEIMYKQAQKRLKEEINKYTEWTIVNFKYWDEDTEKMSDYIKRNDALGCVLGLFDRQRIKEIPAADVSDLRRGKWIFVAQRFYDGGYIDIFRCSCCGIPEGKEYRFCPNCGARMDGGEEK